MSMRVSAVARGARILAVLAVAAFACGTAARADSGVTAKFGAQVEETKDGTCKLTLCIVKYDMASVDRLVTDMSCKLVLPLSTNGGPHRILMSGGSTTAFDASVNYRAFDVASNTVVFQMNQQFIHINPKGTQIVLKIYLTQDVGGAGTLTCTLLSQKSRL